MTYYEVWVASQRYHGEGFLTYSHSGALTRGTLVAVQLQNQIVMAVVMKIAKEPTFKTKPIKDVISDQVIPEQLLDLLTWMRSYYPAPLGQLASLAIPSNVGAKSRASTQALPPRPEKLSAVLAMTADQVSALNSINRAYPRNVLLHGNTGSGKTRLYLELIGQQLEKNKSTILLTPEIGLTPHLVQSAEKHFPNSVVIIHSDMSAAKRRDAWLKILTSSEPLIVIGPRSALFVPLKRIGLIVLDEFHETSYKQEQAPHYLASRVAAQLAFNHHAQLILGSATPLLTDYYYFKHKRLPVVRMVRPALQEIEQKKDVVIIDLKKREQFSRSPWISDKLIDGITQAMSRQEQSLIFLNRRGSARLILCKNCGWEATCPRCDLPLTYHADRHSSVCHTCGYHQHTQSSCPNCSSDDIIFRTIGTKSLVAELERLFPKARILRFDSDTAKDERLEHQYDRIITGGVDILVGTQMLGKGLDLPKLSVLGIVQADTSLTFPDYTAQERTYQLITQALGRINRGHRAGHAVIQTYHPNSPTLIAAISQDYESFYAAEIDERHVYNFPPFCFVLKVSCSRASTAAAKRTSEQLAQKIRSRFRGIQIVGPSPSFIEKVNNRYNWQIILKSKSRPTLTSIITELPANCSYDIDPINLL